MTNAQLVEEYAAENNRQRARIRGLRLQVEELELLVREADAYIAAYAKEYPYANSFKDSLAIWVQRAGLLLSAGNARTRAGEPRE